MILRNILMYSFFASMFVLTACDGDVFYEKGIQYFTIDSEVGQNCYKAVSQKAKWGLQIIKPKYFAFNWSKVIEENRDGFDVKVDKCKMKNYTIYGANSFMAGNAFGAARRVYMVCIKNNITNEYVAQYTDDDPFTSMDNTARFYNGNPCEQYDTLAKNMEYELKFNQ